MTLAGAPLGAPPRHFWRSSRSAAAPGRASGRGICAEPVQRAPRRAVLMPPGTMPGAARVQAYEACPQGPPLAPSFERLRKTPLSERGGDACTYFPSEVNIILGNSSHKFVKCTWIETAVAADADSPDREALDLGSSALISAVTGALAGSSWSNHEHPTLPSLKNPASPPAASAPGRS